MEIKYFPAPPPCFTLPTAQLISLNPQRSLIKLAAAGPPSLQMCLVSLHTSLAIRTIMCQSRGAGRLACVRQKHSSERPWRVSSTQSSQASEQRSEFCSSSAVLWEGWELTTVMICAKCGCSHAVYSLGLSKQIDLNASAVKEEGKECCDLPRPWWKTSVDRCEGRTCRYSSVLSWYLTRETV